MAIKVSTGLRDKMMAGDGILSLFNYGTTVLDIYSVGTASIPTTADAAATGTLLVRITDASQAVGSKKKVTIAANAGDAGANVFKVTLNDVTVEFTDAGSSSATQIATGLCNLLGVLNGGAITTPAGVINSPDHNGNFTLVDGGAGSFTIEAATLGESFDCSVTQTGVGTGTLTLTSTTADGGLKFETKGGISSGEIEKLSTQTWSGAAVADGTAAYFRIHHYDDAGGSSTTEYRIQGTVGTSGADLNMTKVNVVTGETHTIDTFSISMPAS